MMINSCQTELEARARRRQEELQTFKSELDAQAEAKMADTRGQDERYVREQRRLYERLKQQLGEHIHLAEARAAQRQGRVAQGSTLKATRDT